MTDYLPTMQQARLAYAHDSGLHERFSDEAYKREAAEAEAEFDRLIAEVERAAAEKAWDEGQEAGVENASHWDGWRYLRDPIPNPYRKETP